MMKRYLLSIILGVLTFANYSYGQVELNFVGQSGNANGTIDVDVTVNGVTNLGGLQYSASWDSLVMTFNSVVSINTDLAEFVPSNISGPEGEALDEGQLSFAYGNPNGNGTLPDGSVLFTVRFDLVGEECDVTTIEIGNDPTIIEAFNGSFDILDVTATSGDMMINGADCGGSTGDELTITGATLSTGPGTNICVPLTVTNFVNVQAGSGTILWDPAVLTYTGINNLGLGGVDGSLNASNVAGGELKFVWSNPDPENPVTLADGASIFDICFDAVGTLGQMSTITLSTEGSLGFEWFDDNDDVIPQVLNNGKVTISEDVGPPFTITVSDVTASMDSGTGCVDVSVDNFVDIISTQYVLTWDTDIINNMVPTDIMLDGVNSGSFNINQAAGSSTFIWTEPAGLTLPNGTVNYSLCFDLVGECDETSPVQVVSQGSTNIEIINTSVEEITNVAINQGSITIGCEPVCEVANIDRPCAGSLNGNITVNVEDGCDYSWANSAGTEIATSKNLLGVGAGSYILTVSCGGVETCVLPVDVEALPSPTIAGSVSPAACGELGAIDVTVSGGGGTYDYNWSPTQPNSPNIENLNPGTYFLTVTDQGSSCTATSTFQIETNEEALEIDNAAVNGETCNENSGSITLTVTGGCTPYTYAWSDTSIGNIPNATNLSDGTYMVTITDDATPQNTVIDTYTVGELSLMSLNGAANITPTMAGGSTGAISITVMGGASPYSYSWMGTTTGLPNSNSIMNLAAGTYNVTVTDDDGCMMSFGPYEVVVGEGGVAVLANVEAVDLGNGFAVACTGDETGSISVTINSGTPPFNVTATGATTTNTTINQLGTFTIDGLAAGTYSISVMNSAGTATESDIAVTEPDDVLVLDIDTGCEEDDQADGFIDLNPDGGFGDLTFDWGNANLVGESLDNLEQGSYTVRVEDANGCIILETIDIAPCTVVDPGCYEVRNVITPNGDGMNDNFAVSCVTDFTTSLEVFDRWGQLVYNQDSYDGQWLGISNSNEELIEGGYMYVMIIDFGSGNREVMKGTVTILRD